MAAFVAGPDKNDFLSRVVATERRFEASVRSNSNDNDIVSSKNDICPKEND